MKLIKVLTLLFVMVVASVQFADATTYYMANNPANKTGWGNGNDSNAGTSKTTPKLTWASVRSVMVGGDTLVICNGTYTGASNMFSWETGGQPPSGTSNNYTTIMAETDGAVTIDGQNARTPVYLYGNNTAADGLFLNSDYVTVHTPANSVSAEYIKFVGIIAQNSNGPAYQDNWITVYSNHIWLDKCGSIDANAGASGFDFWFSDYILVEHSYSFGSSRYKFAGYHSAHVVWRDDISRFDDAIGVGNPVADFMFYNCAHSEGQNLIALDGDQPTKVTAVEVYAGSFANAATAPAIGVGPTPQNWNNVIALNNDNGFNSSSSNTYIATNFFNNVVGWNIRSAANAQNPIHSQGSTYMNHATIGNMTVAQGDPFGGLMDCWSGQSNVCSITNSLITGINTDYMFYNLSGDTYGLDIYANTVSAGLTNNSAHPTSGEYVTTNLTTNGTLKYLPRVETGSIGATIIKQYGKTGTFWGDAGYNLLQDGTNGQDDVNLWPFPNETLIKSKMQAYNNYGVSGDRGFASATAKMLDGVTPRTLTSYIWEYLGNTIPDSIYDGVAPIIAPIANTTATQGTTYISTTPQLTTGLKVRWSKEFGPDDATINSATGVMTWVVPSTLPSESFHFGIRATNNNGQTTYITWVVKVGSGNFVYVNGTTGSDTTGTGSLALPYKTISKGNTSAASGDTIIVQDGTYTGASNMSMGVGTQGSEPPNGTSSAWTTFMSEHPGGALIDGQNTYNPINWHGSYPARVDQSGMGTRATQYIALKGFLFAHGHNSDASSNGSVIFMNYVDHIKIVDCGAYDQLVNDSGSIINVARSGYILIEGSYAYGNGRECITEYLCDNVVTRRNVCRLDRANYADPFGGIVNYGNAYATNQNNIIIDIDQWGHYGYKNAAGSVDDSIGGLRGNGTAINSVQVFSHNTIALNAYNAFLVNVQQDEGGGTGSDPTIMDNIIGWDLKAIPGYTQPAGGDTASYSMITTPGNTQLNQMTFGKWSAPVSHTAFSSFINGTGLNNTVLSNSIIDGVSEFGGLNNGGLFEYATSTNNSIANTGTINYASTANVTGTIVSDPVANGCLKYLPRLEKTCASLLTPSTGTRIGANVTNMRGKSGTLWGDTDYDSDIGYPMWPFPHEDLIKTKMQAYSYSDSESVNPWVNAGNIPSGVHTTGVISGDRGFASSSSRQTNGLPVTLTSYIWEYLGNPMPTSIYNPVIPALADMSNGAIMQGQIYTAHPVLLTSPVNIKWAKEYGPDDMSVDQVSGTVTWNVSATNTNESYNIGVRATNNTGSYTTTTWVVTVGSGAVKYVDNALGNDTTGTGTNLLPYKTITKGISTLASGDTLIIKDGVYTGAANMIVNNLGQGSPIPPSGSSANNGTYTTIIAQHPAKVTIDAQGTYSAVSLVGAWTARDSNVGLGPSITYLAFKGLIAANAYNDGCLNFNHVEHVKAVDCGAYEADAYGTPISFNRSQYVLIEGCYSWGRGRVSIVCYICDYVIMRRNVARADFVDVIWPWGVFDFYSVRHGRSQNNIAIDSDQYSHYTYGQTTMGAFVDDSGAAVNYDWGPHYDNIMWNNIALNNDMGICTKQVDTNSDPMVLNNSIGWDLRAGPNTTGDSIASPIILSATKLNINQSTFGHWRSPHLPLTQSGGTTTPVFFSGWSDNQSITNSIFFDLKDGTNSPAGLFEAIETIDSNDISGVATVNIKNNGAILNPISIDPTATYTATGDTTPSLKYLPRIESSTYLQNHGQSSTRIGATILNMRGKSGTLFGETGFDDDLPSVPMWPFPHEDAIKTGMTSYNLHGVSGNRGFASTSATQTNGLPVTLTSYIWEYLGNPMPTTIYDINSLNGACGAANGNKFSTLSSSSLGLCAPGTLTTGSFTIGLNGWTWGCTGVSGGASTTNTTCTATLDNIPPVITSFTLPTTTTTTVVPIATFTGTDENGISAYCTTLTNSPVGCVWTNIAPTTVTFNSAGYQSAYAWIKDTSGNISSGVVASTKITSEVLGTNIQLAGGDDQNNGALVATKVVLAQAGTLTSISAYVTNTTGSAYLGVYYDSGTTTSYPTSLVIGTTTATTPGVAAGWQTINVTPTVLAAGTYWLALTANNANWAISATGGIGTSTYQSKAYGQMSGSFVYNSAHNFATQYAMYGALTVNTTVDSTIPSVDTFTVGSANSSPLPVTEFTASDVGTGVVGYCITSTNSSNGCNGLWLSTAPTSVIGISGANNYYAWAIDAANNISTSKYQSISIALVPIDGACGSASGGTYLIAPTTNLCSPGTSSLFTGAGPWTWSCIGFNGGGTDSTCNASLQIIPPPPKNIYRMNFKAFIR